MDKIRRWLALRLTTMAQACWPDDTPVEARIRGLSAQPSASTPKDGGGRSATCPECGDRYGHQVTCPVYMPAKVQFTTGPRIKWTEPEKPPATDGGRSDECPPATTLPLEPVTGFWVCSECNPWMRSGQTEHQAWCPMLKWKNVTSQTTVEQTRQFYGTPP